MKVTDIVNAESPNDVIQEMRNHRFIPLPDADAARKALDPDEHDINDPILRPDKRVKVTDDAQGEKVISVEGDGDGNFRTERVARIAVAIQRLIVNRAVSFVFGNDPEYNASPENNNQKAVMAAFDRILYDVKSRSLNRRVARSIFGYKECAELWYTVEMDEPHKTYGFPTEFKLRCAVFSPERGDTLYPYFDATGDMVAFSRAFSRKEGGKSINYFETYTDEEHCLWVEGANGYEMAEGYPKLVAIGKIPVVFGHQDRFETQDVDKLVDRLEKLLSNFADTNDYHASPKIFTTGQINGWSKKGESGAVIEGEEGATMQYVSWQNAPESVKLEIETLLRLIYTITQTPDISFDSVRGIGAVSGVALKLLFMDAHLKVQDKREIFDDYLQRRTSIIKAYIGEFNRNLKDDCDNLLIEPEIVPYMLVDEKEEVEYWMTANGNKALISQEESIEKAGLTSNAESTMEKIGNESARDSSFVIGEPMEA